MKKLIFTLCLAMSTSACAEPTEHPPLEDVPPTYDMAEDQFTITLPMVCTTKADKVFDTLQRERYVLVFLGQTQSLAGGDLYVSVFLNKSQSDYYVLLTNKKTGGVCQVTTGNYGQVFPIDEIGI
jgi:hypothetical protein